MHRRQIVDAGRRMKRVRRAISFARFHASMIMFFGLVTLAVVALQMAFGALDPIHLVLGVGLVVVAANEFWGATLLGRLQLRGPLVLAAGEAGLGLLIIGYCLWSMTHIDASQSQALNDPEIERMLRETYGDIASMAEGLTVMVYGVVIVATVFYQGLVCVYYLTRSWPIQKYIRQTPDWIVEIDRLRAGG